MSKLLKERTALTPRYKLILEVKRVEQSMLNYPALNPLDAKSIIARINSLTYDLHHLVEAILEYNDK